MISAKSLRLLQAVRSQGNVINVELDLTHGRTEEVDRETLYEALGLLQLDEAPRTFGMAFGEPEKGQGGHCFDLRSTVGSMFGT